MEDRGITITVRAEGERPTTTQAQLSIHPDVGKKYRGRVVSYKPYGFFVETEWGGFGLVHGKNIRGWTWKQRFERVFGRGSEVEVTVLDVEPETNRLSFGCEMPDSDCRSGKGDNPCGRPAVSLAAGADDTLPLGRLAKRLNRTAAFPGAKWIAAYMRATRVLTGERAVYGPADLVERLVIPMLDQLGWDVSAGNLGLIRGDARSFSLRLLDGETADARTVLAVLCEASAFASLRGNAEGAGLNERNVVERVLGLYNQLPREASSRARIVWTNGREWVVFSPEILSECVGILAERRGAALMKEMEGRKMTRIVFPSEGGPFAWLAAYAELEAVVAKPEAKGG